MFFNGIANLSWKPAFLLGFGLLALLPKPTNKAPPHIEGSEHFCTFTWIELILPRRAG